MNLNTVSVQEEKNNWYITFLKEKEQKLVNESGFKRVKTQKKIFLCEQGKFNYSFVYVKSNSGKIFSPLRKFLGIGKNSKMNHEFKAKLMMKASRMSYQKAVEDTYESYNVPISKKTLNRYVIDGKKFVNPISNSKLGENVLIADSVKIRNGRKGHHDVMGIMSLNANTNKFSIIGFGINKQPKELAEKIDLKKYAVFVGDADLGLRNFYKNTIPFQVCHLHVIRDISIILWKDGMTKKQRNPYINELKKLLYTLQNSTKKFWLDKDISRLTKRIITTKEELKKLANKFSCMEKFEAAKYLMVHYEHIVTAAKLALKNIKVPWTSNHIERLMQELGIRTKKKGMNWTEKGLEAILNIILKRYSLPKERRNYKEIFEIKSQQVIEI